MFWFEITVMGIWYFFNQCIIKIILAFVLESLLSCFRCVRRFNFIINHIIQATRIHFHVFSEHSKAARDNASQYGAYLFALTVLSGISTIHFLYYSFHCAMKARVAITSIVYRKVSTKK